MRRDVGHNLTHRTSPNSLVGGASELVVVQLNTLNSIRSFKSDGLSSADKTKRGALRVRIEHPNPNVWELSLAQMCLGRPEFRDLLSSLYARRITKVRDIEYRRIAAIFEGVDLTFEQKRRFLERLKSFALARFTPY